MNRLALPWAVFLSLTIAVLGTDYIMRSQNGEIWNGGLSDGTLYLSLLISVLLSLAIFVKRLLTIEPRRKAIVLGVINITAGFIVYAALTFIYVVGLGIDSV